MRPTITSVQSQLGEEHPLARVLAVRAVVVRDIASLVTLAVALAPGIALGWSVAPWLAGAALAVAAVLLLVSACLRLHRRELVIALIATGHENCPAVAGERARLVRARYRRLLARTLERTARAAIDPRASMRSATVPCNAAAIREALPLLEEVCELLVAERPGPRGVALLHQLIVAGDSPLHVGDPQRLREELRRIAVLLQEPRMS
jgi:hypothetical protein